MGTLLQHDHPYKPRDPIQQEIARRRQLLLLLLLSKVRERTNGSPSNADREPRQIYRGDAAMVNSMSHFTGTSVHGIDGLIGTVESVLFDDRSWAVSYLVVEAAGWLPSGKLLIPPDAITRPAAPVDGIAVALTRAQLEARSGANTTQPPTGLNSQSFVGQHAYRTIRTTGMGEYIGVVTRLRAIGLSNLRDADSDQTLEVDGTSYDDVFTPGR